MSPLTSLMQTYRRQPVAFVRGEGATLWDDQGRPYLDFLSGLGVAGIGHCHPKVVAAVQRQAATLLHCSNLYGIPLQEELAAGLTARAFGGKAFFCNSGAEANEGAIKLARRYGGEGRRTVVSCSRSFHGRTLGALAATGQTQYQEGFAPLPGGFKHVAFNDLTALEEALDEGTCAVLLEPVQGEGGVYPADGRYLAGVRKLCDERGILLIFDEVQCGLGRTGTLFAYQGYGVVPDILTLAKALGGGVPIGAMLAGDGVAAAFTPGSHASTFGGNPLSAAAALAVLQVMDEEGLPARAAALGEYFQAGLRQLAADRLVISDVRGRGLMVGVELAGGGAGAVIGELRERGILAGAIADRILRFLPPLIIDEADIDTVLAALGDVLGGHKGG
ncbi:MAG: aspartate aminotransferase family protein [Bacillota bacterium]